MIQKTEERLWGLMGELRGELTLEEGIDIFSQLLVMDSLTRKDNEFENTVISKANAGAFSASDLTNPASQSLRNLGVADAEDLIDPSSRGWSGLSAIWITKALLNLINDDATGTEKGRWMLTHFFKGSRGPWNVPSEIVKLMYAILTDPDPLYMPFDESVLAVLDTAESEQPTTLRPQSTWVRKIVARALFVADRKVEMQKLDPYSSDNIDEGTPILMIPPFGARLESNRTMDLPSVFHGAKRLTSEEVAIASLAGQTDRTIVALVPSGLLFKGGLSKILREWLIEEIGLVTVIELPPRVLTNTSIGCAVLVIHPVGALLADTVRLVTVEDGDYLEEYQSGRFRLTGWEAIAELAWSSEVEDNQSVKHVPKKVIRSNDYVLTPARYQTSKLETLFNGAKIEKLSNVCEIIRPIPVKSIEDSNASLYYEVLMSDFNRDGTVRQGSRERYLDAASKSKTRRQRLQAGDILLGVKGTVGKVAIVPSDANENLMAGQTTVLLRLQEGSPISDPAYLLRYLTQPEVSEHLQSLAGGSAISFIRAKDLGDLQVPIQSIEEQKKIRLVHERVIETLAESNRLRTKADQINMEAFH